MALLIVRSTFPVQIPNAPQHPVARRQYGFQFQAPLRFVALDGGPFRLAMAYEKEIQRHLRAYDTPVLTNAGTKYTVLIHVCCLTGRLSLL